MTDNDVTSTDNEQPQGGSRRDLLSKAAIAAAVTTVAGLSMSRQASAANGQALVIGQANIGTLTTGLQNGSTFQVVNGTTAGITGPGARVGSVYGQTSGYQTAGVLGSASGTEGWGVYGKATGTSGRGVYGMSTSTSGVGVYGDHNSSTISGTGVVGRAVLGIGVEASGSTTDLIATGSGRLQFVANGVPPTPAAGAAGTVAKDSDGNLWVCVTSGSWRKLAGPASSGTLHLLAAPKRVYDSRAGEAPAVEPKTPLTNLTARTIDCTGNSSGVPVTARGVLLNVTVISVSATGFLAVTPGGAGFTGTSTLNWSAANAVIANSATSACGANATIDVTAGGGGSTNVLVDVFGYYL